VVAAALDALGGFSALMKTASSSSSSSTATATATATAAQRAETVPSAHLAPLFGAVCRATGVPLEQTAYIFLLGHVKALVSAAVRASVFGPYQAQRTLAAGGTRDMIDAAVRKEWWTKPEEAGQSVPVLDLWVGRHELLYSRIFNS